MPAAVVHSMHQQRPGWLLSRGMWPLREICDVLQLTEDTRSTAVASYTSSTYRWCSEFRSR